MASLGSKRKSEQLAVLKERAKIKEEQLSCATTERTHLNSLGKRVRAKIHTFSFTLARRVTTHRDICLRAQNSDK